MTIEQAKARERVRHSVYGETVNVSLMRLFSPGARILDIGCGTGAWGPDLKQRGARELIGVEISQTAASMAGKHYDRVHRDPIECLDLNALGARLFDTIIAADVLEHLVDPWSELARWRSWVEPEGKLVLSVPNLRYFRILLRVTVQGRFDYEDGGGLMDRTHIRWFTRKSLADDLQVAGWHPVTWGNPAGRRASRVSRLAGGRLDDLLVPQLQAVCLPGG